MAKAGTEAPDLSALIAAHGGYHLIPPDAWAAYDLAMMEHRQSMHERHRIATSTVAVGVHFVAVAQDYKRFARWLDTQAHTQRLLIARAIWRALKQPYNRTQLEDWMKIYLRDRGEH